MSSTKKICIENDTDQRVPTSVKKVPVEMCEDYAILKKRRAYCGIIPNCNVDCRVEVCKCAYIRQSWKRR